MNLQNIPAGKKPPKDINVIIEIPANSSPVKYEVDKDSHLLTVDRFMSAPMFYPANYGYIPQTLADDGDPLDVLVLTPYPLTFGCVIRSRVLGMLNMSDEKGQDEKLIAVPHHDLTPLYDQVNVYSDLPSLFLQQVEHFFENYKTLEAGKWVKINQWEGLEASFTVVERSISNFKNK